MATTLLNLLHLPFSTSAPSFPSRQLPSHLPLKSQLNNSNSLVCKARECYNVEVQIEEDEPAELCMRYFEREVARAGIFQEWRRRKFHENKKEESKRKTQERARLRRRRSVGRSNSSKGDSSGSSYPEEEHMNESLMRLLDSDYEEGNIEILDMDFPDEEWESDSNGEPIDY